MSVSISAKAVTRSSLRNRSCYDAYILKELSFAELCGNCRNYLSIPYKKKKQSEMGKRDYHCKTPGKESCLSSPEPTEGRKRITPHERSFEKNNHHPEPENKKRRCDYKAVNEELRTTVESGVNEIRTLKHELHVACSEVECNKNSIISLQKELYEARFVAESLEEELHKANYEIKCKTEENDAVHFNMACYEEEVNLANCEIESLKEKLACSEREVIQSRERLSAVEEYARNLEEQLNLSQAQGVAQDELSRYYRNKLSTVRCQVTEMISEDPFSAAKNLLQELMNKQVDVNEIVNGFMRALTRTRQMKKQVAKFLIAQENHLSQIKTYFGGLMYKELQDKFKTWVCLRELDLVATVSFRGYDTIRKIEFHEEDNSKYMRGLFKSRQQLSRMSRLLEDHGGRIIPYQVTENAVKFDVKTAVKWLLEKYGLWSYVERGDTVSTAATVDGGELAWQLTQVSAGIKICDARAKDPRTGQDLFGESGHKHVQSRNVCFPLHVHITKDSGAFYDQHLAEFFRDVNELENEYAEGLVFTHGADMSSLQKTLKRGKKYSI